MITLRGFAVAVGVYLFLNAGGLQAQALHDPIAVKGEVIRHGADGSLLLWGETFGCTPRLEEYRVGQPGCFPAEESVNIKLLGFTNPEALKKHYGPQDGEFYLSQSREFYYVGHLSIRNQFDQPVPVFVYGSLDQALAGVTSTARKPVVAKFRANQATAEKREPGRVSAREAVSSRALGVKLPGDVRFSGTVHETQGPSPDGRVVLTVCPDKGRDCVDITTTTQLIPHVQALAPRSVGGSVELTTIRADVYKCDAPPPGIRESFCLRQISTGKDAS